MGCNSRAPPHRPLPHPTGGTLLECQRLLTSMGASAVSAYVTHGVFPRESWRKFQAAPGSDAAAPFKWVAWTCSLRGPEGREALWSTWAMGTSLDARLSHAQGGTSRCTSSLHKPPQGPLPSHPTLDHPTTPPTRYFWITDSCPKTCQAVENQAPFEILSLATPIAAALRL